MLPLLKFISDGKDHSTKDAVDFLGKEFNLSDDDLNEWLPSKKQKTFHNRVHWAKAHLKMAGAIENLQKGNFKITDRGNLVLKEAPSFVNVKYLTSKFEDYQNIICGFRKSPTEKNFIPVEKIQIIETPEELIESGYQKIRQSLESELLSKLKSVHPSFLKKS